MKKYLLTLLVFLNSYAVFSQWSLSWSDEFSTASIDTNHWNFETGNWGWGNNELQYYTNHSDNATVHNGNLLIIAKQESFGGSNYTSARMITKGKHSWTYGKIEARIKLNQSKGIWPAFWMLGDNIGTVGWPQCGELDIMEHINNDTVIHGTMHWDDNGHAQYGQQINCDVAQYHNYSIEWDQDSIKWLLDGNIYLKALIANNVNSTDELHNSFYIILNMAVGGNWPGNPDATSALPDTMFVDYVRVYQKLNGIKDGGMNLNNKFDIYPNPATDKLLLETNNTYKKQTVDIISPICQNIYSTRSEVVAPPSYYQLRLRLQ